MPKRQIICKHCKIKFETYDDAKYCSRKCWKLGHKVWNKGKKLEYTPKTIFKKGQNLRENHPNWKGGKWCWVKRFVINRDNGTCQICKLNEKDIMDVAHKKGFENKGKNRRYINHNPDHLITLCPNCHRRYDLNKLQL